MILEHTNYRTFLKSLLVEKQKQNSAFSMRAFAKQIGIGQSALSQVIAGKKNLSLERATLIANKLNFTTKESEYFRLLIQLEGAKNLDFKKTILQQLSSLHPQNTVRDLTVDFFSMISDWYHLVIKNMVYLKKFKMTPENIANKIGISKIEAETALERLVRLELIEKDVKNEHQYNVVENYVMTKSVVPNGALRKFHKQMLNKAIDSLETQTPKEKFIGSETFAISEKDLPLAFEYADEFLKKVASLSKKEKEADHVYHTNVQIFNLTKGHTK